MFLTNCVWQTFLGFMNGKSPQTVLTDQNMWLKESLAAEMPSTKHAFCIWHIVPNFSNWFSILLGSQYDRWKAEFLRLYDLHSVEEFESGWREMVDTYALHGNKHIASLYTLRTYWALPFLRCYFFAGMTGTFQSEAINAYIQRILSAQSVLDNLIEQVLPHSTPKVFLLIITCSNIVFYTCFQVAAMVDMKDRVELKQKMQRKDYRVVLKTGSPIESHAAAVLTPFAFCKLQEELVLAPQYASLMIDENYFIVRHHTQMEGGYKVIWVPHDGFTSCSCHHFEFTGILCRHVLRVISTNNCFHIPDQYLHMRWRDIPLPVVQTPALGEHTERAQWLKSMVSTLVAESIETEERLDFACDHIGLALTRIKGLPGQSRHAHHISYNSPSGSLILPEVEDSDGVGQSFSRIPHDCLALEKPKERRSRDGLDIYRKRRLCPMTCCGQFEHDADDCPLLGGDELNVDNLGFP